MNNKYIVTIEWLLVTVLALIVILGIAYLAYTLGSVLGSFIPPDFIEPVVGTST